MTNYYVNSLKDINAKFDEAAKFYSDIVSKINQLVTVLSESSGDEVEKMVNDLKKYQLKFSNVKDAIDLQKEKMNQRATQYDGWYQSYQIKLHMTSNYEQNIDGQVYNVEEYISDLFVDNDGLINIQQVFIKQKKLNLLETIGSLFIGRTADDSVVTKKIDEMTNFTGGVYKFFVANNDNDFSD